MCGKFFREILTGVGKTLRKWRNLMKNRIFCGELRREMRKNVCGNGEKMRESYRGRGGYFRK